MLTIKVPDVAEFLKTSIENEPDRVSPLKLVCKECGITYTVLRNTWTMSEVQDALMRHTILCPVFCDAPKGEE